MSAKIAFIGLGNMGLPMATNLAKAGFAVTGFDPAKQARDAAAAAGIPVAETLEKAIKGKEIIITMLPNGAIVRNVVGVIGRHAKTGALIIECSTIDIESARWMHEHAKDHALGSVDAPVSGGIAGAGAATLTFMCGGAPEDIERARPVLEKMGKRIVACGPAGSGQAAKICNNMILGVSMIGVCEAFNLADAMGLDRQAMFDVVSASSGSCWSINSYCPVPGVGPTSPADNQYKPGFAAALMLKDLRLSQEAASGSGTATPLGAHATQLYERFVDEGGAARDFSAMIEALREMGREKDT